MLPFLLVSRTKSDHNSTPCHKKFSLHLQCRLFYLNFKIILSFNHKQVYSDTEKFHENLKEPKRVVNHLGQAEFIKATTDVTRFVINSSVGVFGIFDVASRISLFSDDTEFDETSAYWGFPVGPYLELPFVGPSSLRGSLSMLVDYTLNPMSLLSGPAEGASLITFSALNILNKRHEFGTMVDTILYNSLDSYYSTRSTYLQTRINEPPEPMEDNLDLFDPYEDF